ncbi:hypothetical protein C0992_004695 [Termitomyces sp. T32_za158]|nr:hypothetical protein C0992_004695 [Termitomyces sp. T32_za158]
MVSLAKAPFQSSSVMITLVASTSPLERERTSNPLPLVLQIFILANTIINFIYTASLSSSVPVLLVPHTHTGFDPTANPTRPEFGTASLKTCLDAICSSSPELVQDKRRDFSVYVLDPLESNSAPAQVNIPNAASGAQSSDSRSAPEQPRGLAVALGLMSWALMLDETDSTPVTGTVIKLPTGQEALEIIFALKETVAMEKSSLPAALRTWGLPPEPTNSSGTAASGRNIGSSERDDTHSAHHTHHSMSQSTGASSSTSIPSSSYLGHVPTDSTTLATIASIHMRSQHKRAKAKVKKPAKTPSIDPENSEADRLFLSHYVGPERKKAGRPPNAASSGSKSNKSSVRTQASTSTAVESRTAGSSRTALSQISSTATQPPISESNDTKSHAKPTKDPLTNPFTFAPLIRSPRDPEPQSLLDILAFLSSSSSSSDPNVQNTALLAALSAIDSNQAKGSSTGSEKPPSPLLVNALRELISAAAQRPAIPQSAPNNNNAHPPVNNNSRNHVPDDDIVLLDKENVNPTVFRRRSEREGKSFISDASTPPAGSGAILTSGQSNTETPTARGLTARPNGKINTTPVPPASASASPLPPPNSTSGSRRKRTLSDFMDEREASKEKEKMREREWVERRDAHRHARSSPKRNELSSIRHYPRLVSDITQSTKRASGSYYRTAETWSSPQPSHERHKWDENSCQISINDSPGLKVSASSPIRSTTTATTKFRKPYVVPAWARTSTSMQPRLSEEAARALELAESKKQEERKARKRGTVRTEKEKKKKRLQSASPSPSNTASRQKGSTSSLSQCPPPVTVASNGPMFALTSAIQDRIAAFSSPVSSEPQSPRSNKPALPCTPPRKRNSDLFSPGDDGSLFTPVPGRRFSNKKTPVRSARKSSPKTPKASKKTNEDGNEASGEESEDELEDVLKGELDNALDELDMPSSSLPNVSSDVEMESERSENFEDTDAEIPKKQHWIGLPPSSPPPPTSPLILPQYDESDDTMLPAVTSDADLCPTDSEACTDSMYTESSACTDEELAGYLESDFPSIFAPVSQTTFGNDSTQSNMNLFDQFTNHAVQSDGAEQNTGLDPNFDALQEGLVDFDLAEFWETFKPLLQDQNGNVASGSVNTASGQIAENQVFDPKVFDPVNLDHMKLAEDVQALFSGCVV